MRQKEIVGWHRETFPTGWFQVAWTPEIAEGQAVGRHYWSRDLVVWRGESGQLHAMDAHETRRGADLARWGTVEGEALVCRLDGWAWQPDGTALTPDGRTVTGPDGGTALRTYPVAEPMGLVILWYDELGEPPTWDVEVSPETTSPEYYPAWPHGVAVEAMSCQPQIMAENMPDVVHVRYAHRWLDIPTITDWQEGGPRIDIGYEGRFDSPRGPVDAVFSNTGYGFGVLRTRMASLRRFVHFLCPTPIDHHTMHVRLSAWVERAPGDPNDEPDKVAKALIKAQHHEVLGQEVDRIIWENQAYLAQPGFRSQERQYIAWRKWAEQFYPHEPQARPAAV